MSVTGTSPGKSFPPRNILSGMGMGITLPLNNSVSQLATLSHSNHTLSPYARGHEHIAVRSFPHLGKTPSSSMGAQSRSTSGEGIINGNLKARRKRIYRLGAKKEQTTANSNPNSNSKSREEEMEMLSPDLDDTPPYATYDSPIPVDQFRRMSFGSTDRMRNGHDYHQQQNQGHSQGQTSLMGMTQRVMRPNMVRSPASRTSYGFPDIG
jgi:distribution and morphology protein 34